MSPTLHPNLLSAFLAGKSCSAIALTFNLTVEEILAWFESDLTQSTLRRLEALQLQQARIVSFSVLPHAAGSLTNTCESADNPALRTRAASNLVRLGLRFTAPSRNAGAPSPWEGVGGGFNSPADLNRQTSRTEETPSPIATDAESEFDPLPDEFTPHDFEALTNEDVTDEDEFSETNAPQFEDPEADFSPLADLADTASNPHSFSASDPSDPFVPFDPSDPSVPSSPPSRPRHKLACEILRDEYAALRAARTSQARTPINHSARSNASTKIHDSSCEPAPPLFSRRKSPVSSLRASAGTAASRDPAQARNSSPPRNLHPPPLMHSAA